MKVFSVLLALFISFSGFAQDAVDVHFTDTLMPEGALKYSGERINTRWVKPAFIIDGSAVESDYADLIQLADGRTLVANFYHEEKFYFAAIPTDKVKETLFLSTPFAPAMAHSMLQFRLSEPIELLAEIPSQEEASKGIKSKKLKSTIKLNDMLFSPEASAPEGVNPFSAVESFFKSRALVLRVMSITGKITQSNYADTINNKGKTVTSQTPLKFTPEESSNAIVNALKISHHFRLDKFYNTIGDNCNSNCFKVIERTKPFVYPGQGVFESALGIVMATVHKVSPFTKQNPAGAKIGLLWRGWTSRALIKQSTYLANDPEFKEVVKSYPVRAKSCAAKLGGR